MRIDLLNACIHGDPEVVNVRIRHGRRQYEGDFRYIQVEVDVETLVRGRVWLLSVSEVNVVRLSCPGPYLNMRSTVSAISWREKQICVRSGCVTVT